MIVLIIGTLTPMSLMANTTPLGLLFGGPTVPIFFLIAAVVVGVFCVGYVQMVRRISRPGAYYSYIAKGLGRRVGVGAAYAGAVTYAAVIVGGWAVGAYVTAAILPTIGLFPTATPDQLFPWVFVAMILVVGFLVRREIDVSAVVGLIIVAVEILVMAVFVIAVVVQHGLDFAVFTPTTFEYGDWRVALIFAVLGFQSFESGAMYAPEATRPERTIPRALYGSLAILAAAAVFSSWALISHVGIANLQTTIGEHGGIGYVLALMAHYLGPAGTVVFSTALILSNVLGTLGLTNFAARYLNGLAKDDLLPRWFSSTNTHGAPNTCLYAVIGLAALASGACLVFGAAPYVQLTPIGFGLATIGSTVLLLLSSMSVIGFFRQLPASAGHWWKTGAAPVLASVLIVVTIGLELWGFGYITGSSEPWTNYLPVLIAAVLITGFLVAVWLRRNRPEVYADLGAGDSAEEAREVRARRLRASGVLDTPQAADNLGARDGGTEVVR
ncbi:APC family permease [Amycolatopsis lurida]